MSAFRELDRQAQGVIQFLDRRYEAMITSILTRKMRGVFTTSGQVNAAAIGGDGTVSSDFLPVVGGVPLILHPPYQAASSAATNLAASTFSAVDDPNYRAFADLRNMSSVRILGRIGGSLVAASKLRVQYHTGGDPAVASGDGGWTTLATTVGSHTVNVLFYSAALTVPSGAQINDCLVRVGLYDGDGAADPTLSCAELLFTA